LDDGIKIPTSLSDEQVRLLRSDFLEFIPTFTKKPGLSKLYQHRFDTGDVRPIKERFVSVSPGKRKIFDLYFDKLLNYDVIEPSNSPWASIAFLVPKPDGQLRFVINYKPLNKVTVPDTYPINRIDDMLAFLGEAKYFTVLHCSKGFYQIKMTPEDRQKKAFLSH
jgi:hypothetical protein